VRLQGIDDSGCNTELLVVTDTHPASKEASVLLRRFTEKARPGAPAKGEFQSYCDLELEY
jgi:hypothetical protein